LYRCIATCGHFKPYRLSLGERAKATKSVHSAQKHGRLSQKHSRAFNKLAFSNQARIESVLMTASSGALGIGPIFAVAQWQVLAGGLG
jgi:hypothetical protein